MMAYYRLGVVFVLSIMNLDRSFGYLVHDVARLFGRRFDQRALRYVGLNRSQCRILGCLARDEGINQARLAELLEVKPMTQGWVERRSDPGDRRAHRLVLTERARPLLARILALSAELRREAFADLTEEEGRHLVELLRRVRGGLSGSAVMRAQRGGGGRSPQLAERVSGSAGVAMWEGSR
jgi:MarR family transcriptional regulator for hemolysin